MAEIYRTVELKLSKAGIGHLQTALQTLREAGIGLHYNGCQEVIREIEAAVKCFVTQNQPPISPATHEFVGMFRPEFQAVIDQYRTKEEALVFGQLLVEMQTAIGPRNFESSRALRESYLSGDFDVPQYRKLTLAERQPTCKCGHTTQSKITHD